MRMNDKPPKLTALCNGVLVGNVYGRSGGLEFIYDEGWRNAPGAYPLSLSMPLAAEQHGHDKINAYLWGLLPDNERTIEQYARQFGVSVRSPTGLLEFMGADCAGAVQFVVPERVEKVLADPMAAPEIEWLTEADVARDLKAVRERGSLGAGTRKTGQFSLAGAQPKIALLEEDGRWGRPAGRTPTTRILKPPTGEFVGFAENEHLCLALARELGLGAVQSSVMRFEDEPAIVVERYDRRLVQGIYHRIHQEDVCQALGLMPTRKYEAEGGPGIRSVIEILRDYSTRPSEDVDRFLGAIALNWIIVGTDGHAKNFALLHAAAGESRLAPFYDITSFLPYAEEPLHKVKLAMRVGREYEVRRIGPSDWKKLAGTAGVPHEELVGRVVAMIDGMDQVLDQIESRSIEEGLDADIVHDLVGRISTRLHVCRGAMAAT